MQCVFKELALVTGLATDLKTDKLVFSNDTSGVKSVTRLCWPHFGDNKWSLLSNLGLIPDMANLYLYYGTALKSRPWSNDWYGRHF